MNIKKLNRTSQGYAAFAELRKDRIWSNNDKAVRCGCAHIKGIDSEELTTLSKLRNQEDVQPHICFSHVFIIHFAMLFGMVICNRACVHMDKIWCNNDEAIRSGFAEIDGIYSEKLTTFVKLLNRNDVQPHISCFHVVSIHVSFSATLDS